MKKVLYVLMAMAGLALIFFAYVSYQLSPVSKDQNEQAFVVNKGDGIRLISRRLHQNGLIRNSQVFLAYSYLTGLHGRLQAGSFILSPHLSTPSIVTNLSQPGRQEYWIKILEGWRNDEIANYFEANNIVDAKAFRARTMPLEGRLFPDSYLIPEDYQLDQILDLISKNFQKKLDQAKTGTLVSGLSDEELVILASLVEREARTPTSKAMVAGVLQNRLKLGMPLQVDATVQYARDSQIPRPTEYWQPLKKSEMAVTSPYNTYQNSGLPPGAICNPGYDSFYAVYHPEKHDYLYYITGNDNQMHYAVTLDEHNANIDRYLR